MKALDGNTYGKFREISGGLYCPFERVKQNLCFICLPHTIMGKLQARFEMLKTWEVICLIT